MISRPDMKIKLDDGAFAPIRAHDTDAGLDLRSPVSKTIEAGSSATIDTGIHVEIPQCCFGKVESKSGLNVNHSIVCCGGVIDEGNTGSIVVKLYNLSDKDYQIQPGDKIAQLVIQPCFQPRLWLANSLEETERGDNGFGSSGK